MISCLVVVAWRSAIHLMEGLVRVINMRCVFRRMSLDEFSRVSSSFIDSTCTLTIIDQMTIMVESSRSFLFTEYARGGCGTFHNQGTDPKVWDVLPVSLVSYILFFLVKFD